ncbi:DEAD/DEAH box helicase [Alkalinema sp. FACHB-956]|uniref:DEAD/DEAH box helicase n=1 Tax=Alkalinema sp. FACHB-956 TaxID=2692768 RepID=UPI0016837E9E|nr:DEAD/DEAH box helicase [Alkalinema sp. FACHB-956]MBD2328656.1 DEAD/DEAH box helicase [Alkalinema sp. FACHB-956]
MDILHGTWIPDTDPEFIQTGQFYLWVETEENSRRKRSPETHPRHLRTPDLIPFLCETLGIKPYKNAAKDPHQALEADIIPRSFLLPTAKKQPLPSWEMARYLEAELPDRYEWQYWEIDCYATVIYLNYKTNVNNVIKFLNDLHFLTQYRLSDVQMGADLLFWYHYTQRFKQVILRDQYIPALKYREITPASPTPPRKTTRSKPAIAAAPPAFEIHPGWEIISEQYDTLIQTAISQMPLLCCAGFADPSEQACFYDRETLLRHFSECLLDEILIHTPRPTALEKKIQGTLLHACLDPSDPWTTAAALGLYEQWQQWRDRINQSQAPENFNLCFQLDEPQDPDDPWELVFQASPKTDPSHRIDLGLYWRTHRKDRHKLGLGQDFEQSLLLHLGYAARIYPKLWAGLETDRPSEITLNLSEAFDFLQESAWVLEAAGYQVLVPTWWTPKGRQRAKVRLRAHTQPKSSSESTGYFSATALASYDYELAIGDQTISEREWQTLVNSKMPMVQFRGKWMVLDQAKMKQMLEFWKKEREQKPELSLIDLMKFSAGSDDDVDLAVDHDRTLSAMIDRLNHPTQMEEIADPPTFQGQLRPYQRRGVSWLVYLESLGLNGCLADDMGMGKSAQVIARLVYEREQGHPKSPTRRRNASTIDRPIDLAPTLLIAPTSVVGNWGKEIEKFAPHLRFMLHHGADRIRDAKALKTAIADCDVVITSYTLARMDEALLSGQTWHRIVIDEAQNIKNPKAAQTKAILKLPSTHRLALTGTPVENRLMDLWSIFNFLNPGYLGKESQFRQSFEIPIQKDNNLSQSQTLKKLVEPFILRRVKTDPAIIQDLPDKVEQKCYCNLTKEQASLYQAVVKEISESIDQITGIKRKGMILATLTKLKQICNHPMQFLQDNSEFTATRSHKLERLLEMIEEIRSEGESLLIFTQFTEIGEALEKTFKQQHYNTYYLHGGTLRAKREKMIAEFQDPNTEPSIFILSLKAGGVGITLTRANHVFHFDRWWNPAVEDQATDRAFRIGQTKNVFVHKFIALGTLEEKIDQMIEDKKKLAGAIVGNDEAWLSELDNRAFKQLIALNKKAIVD